MRFAPSKPNSSQDRKVCAQRPLNQIAPLFYERNMRTTGQTANNTGPQLNTFKPSKAPYVPILLQVLINYVEKFGCNWEYLYLIDHGSKARACRLLDFLAALEEQDRFVMVDAMQASTLAEAGIAIKVFLQALPDKLLRTAGSGGKEEQEENRPVGSGGQEEQKENQPVEKNKESDKDDVGKMKALMQTPEDECSLHTLCFLMIHLLHTWEYSANALVCRKLLGDIFGPLLFQQDGKDNAPPGKKEDESAGRSFESLLTEYSIESWYQLSGCPFQLRNIFQHLTPCEIRFFKLQYNCKKTLSTPSIDASSS